LGHVSNGQPGCKSQSPCVQRDCFLKRWCLEGFRPVASARDASGVADQRIIDGHGTNPIDALIGSCLSRLDTLNSTHLDEESTTSGQNYLLSVENYHIAREDRRTILKIREPTEEHCCNNGRLPDDLPIALRDDHGAAPPSAIHHEVEIFDRTPKEIGTDNRFAGELRHSPLRNRPYNVVDYKVQTAASDNARPTMKPGEE